jgi:two-component sensor histidine kinase
MRRDASLGLPSTTAIAFAFVVSGLIANAANYGKPGSREPSN